MAYNAKSKESGEAKMEKGRSQSCRRIRRRKRRVSVKVNKLSWCPNTKDCQRKKMKKKY